MFVEEFPKLFLMKKKKTKSVSNLNGSFRQHKTTRLSALVSADQNFAFKDNKVNINNANCFASSFQVS